MKTTKSVLSKNLKFGVSVLMLTFIAGMAFAGYEQLTCSKCYGTGQVECYSCSGTGQVKTWVDDQPKSDLDVDSILDNSIFRSK